MKSFLKYLLSTVLVWFTGAPAIAQTDPEARDYAWTLYAVFQEALDAQDPAKFKEAVERDALKSRRAFISALEYAKEQKSSSPEDARGAVVFAAYLAHQIAESFQDPVPNEIIQGIKDELPEDVMFKKVEEYARTLYPELSPDKAP